MGPFYRFFQVPSGLQKMIPGAILTGLLFFASPAMHASTSQDDCEGGFTTTIESIQTEDQCVVFELLIEATGTSKSALSHFVASVPCGEISAASNSEGWKMEYPVTDPTSGVTGIKVDDISGFGENGSETFRLTYTVCASDNACLDILSQQSLEVAYKAGQCIYTEEITIANQPLSANLEAAHLTCYDASNGSIGVTVDGGVSPYQFQWSNGATSQNIENLSKGTYNLTITDAADSTLVLSTQVEAPAPIKASANITDTECGQTSGAIDLSVDGGTAPYTFLWNEGHTTEDLNQLAAGDYSVSITDNNGCQIQALYTVKETSSLQIEASQVNLQCHETGTGSINIEVSGGTAPYSYLWSTGDTTQHLSNLDEGTYFIWVTDDMGCIQSRQIRITKEQLQAEISSSNAGCVEDNGSATITSLSGSEPYNIVWQNGDTTMTADNLAAGTHSVEITVINGCQITEEVIVSRNSGPQINVSSAWTGCTTEDSIEVSLTASGGQEPYEWLINEESSKETFYLTEETELLVTATDQNGCAVSKMVSVSPGPAGPQIRLNVIDASCSSATGAASVNIEGDGPFPVFWDEIQGSTYKSGLEPGSHEVKVVDSNGCETTETFSISEMIIPTAEILTAQTQVDCNNANNLLNATVTNAETISWEFESADNSWFFTSTDSETATYITGTDSAIAMITATSSSGCVASDYILLQCTGTSEPTDSISNGTDDPTDDGGTDDGGTDDGSQDDTIDDANEDIPGDEEDENPIIDEPCSTGCYEITSEPVVSTGENCYQYSYTIKTDGTCRFDLSHLIIELPDGTTAVNASNSLNFPMEINSTDPKSGIYGIKVDEISGFNQYNNEITVSFGVCNGQLPQDDIRMAFKAGQCLDIIEFNNSGNNINRVSDQQGTVSLKVYPNPSPSNVTFSFTVPEATNVNIELFDIAGNKIETVFEGEALKNIEYKIPAQLNRSHERLFYYKMQAGKEVKSGKILKY
jgi:hypothetical protein